MASFSAGKIVEQLDYDFTDMKGVDYAAVPCLASAKGTIREPSSRQLQQFMNAMRLEADRTEHLFDDLADDAKIAAIVERLGPETVDEARKRTAEIHSALCSGLPTAEQLEALPHRIFNAFSTWLKKEVTDPEAVAGGGSAQVLSLPSAAAG